MCKICFHCALHVIYYVTVSTHCHNNNPSLVCVILYIQVETTLLDLLVIIIELFCNVTE